MLLKFDYAEFGISNLLFSKVIEAKPWVKEGVNENASRKHNYQEIIFQLDNAKFLSTKTTAVTQFFDENY